MDLLDWVTAGLAVIVVYAAFKSPLKPRTDVKPRARRRHAEDQHQGHAHAPIRLFLDRFVIICLCIRVVTALGGQRST